MTVKGIDQAENALDDLAKNLDKSMHKALLTGANLVRSTAVKSIQSTSDGRIVLRQRQRGSGSYEHQAAGQGQAPNTDTGALVKSIAVEPVKDGYAVGSNLDYARYLEFGGDTAESGSAVYARPWLYPAYMANRKKIKKAINQAIKKAAR